jgi:nitric oxide reductase large subunit
LAVHVVGLRDLAKLQLQRARVVEVTMEDSKVGIVALVDLVVVAAFREVRGTSSIDIAVLVDLAAVLVFLVGVIGTHSYFDAGSAIVNMSVAEIDSVVEIVPVVVAFALECR